MLKYSEISPSELQIIILIAYLKYLLKKYTIHYFILVVSLLLLKENCLLRNF